MNLFEAIEQLQKKTPGLRVSTSTSCVTTMGGDTRITTKVSVIVGCHENCNATHCDAHEISNDEGRITSDDEVIAVMLKGYEKATSLRDEHIRKTIENTWSDYTRLGAALEGLTVLQKGLEKEESDG